MDIYNLKRFLDAQEHSYQTALAELQAGRKRSHWMWFIFPQIAGLGFSETSRFYSIKSKPEAKAYLEHPILGARLLEICNVLINLPDNHATRIFGSPDDLKLKSCMTLFAELPNTSEVFKKVLDKFYNGIKDWETLNLLQKDKTNAANS